MQYLIRSRLRRSWSSSTAFSGAFGLYPSGKVLAEAEECVRQIVDLYEGPNLTVEQVRTSLDSDDFDPLKAFSSACRAELLRLPDTRKLESKQ